MMKFAPLIEKITTARREIQLRSYVMEDAGELLGASAWGFELVDPNFQVIASDLHGLPDTFADCYRQIGLDGDFISQKAIAYHIPVHNLSSYTLEQWHQSQLYQQVLQVYNIEHGMVAPIVGDGRLLGAIYWLRDGNYPAFSDRDSLDVTSLCQHISFRLAALRQGMSSPLTDALTPRELDIAKLVAQGFNNREIGLELCISRETVKKSLKQMFCKLGVSARAEMVAKLAS